MHKVHPEKLQNVFNAVPQLHVRSSGEVAGARRWSSVRRNAIDQIAVSFRKSSVYDIGSTHKPKIQLVQQRYLIYDKALKILTVSHRHVSITGEFSEVHQVVS